MKKYLSRLITAILLASMLITLAVSCTDTSSSDKSKETDRSTADTTSQEETADQNIDTRFDEVDFGGRAFRIYSSVDTTDATNANALIAGSGELNGDIVNDTVYNRNEEVMKLLNVELKFSEAKFTYTNCESEIRKLVMSGDDSYDLIINDIRSFASLSDEGLFQNIYDAENFDYSKSYWYKSCMDDLMLIPEYSYIMAGDYFMDIIASCHALFYNKDIIESKYGNPNYIYEMVLDGKWTLENLTKLVDESYSDLNGDGVVNEGDLFGLTMEGAWGAAIPYIGAAGIQFIDRSSGVPEYSFDNVRSVGFLEALNKLFWSKGTLDKIKDNKDIPLGLRNLMSNGQSVIIGYNRLGDLSKMRDFTFDIGVVPYPKYDENDNYITSMHDTTEVGVIPVTATDMKFITTVIEVLNRETNKILIPEYYETALKVKYTTDEISATMIDIIHDNFGASFPVAYNNALGDCMFQCFTEPLSKKSNDFASTYAAKETKANTSLQKMLENLKEANGIS